MAGQMYRRGRPSPGRPPAHANPPPGFLVTTAAMEPHPRHCRMTCSYPGMLIPALICPIRPCRPRRRFIPHNTGTAKQHGYPMSDTMNHHEALIYVVVMMSAVDTAMTDAELE